MSQAQKNFKIFQANQKAYPQYTAAAVQVIEVLQNTEYSRYDAHLDAAGELPLTVIIQDSGWIIVNGVQLDPLAAANLMVALRVDADEYDREMAAVARLAV